MPTFDTPDPISVAMELGVGAIRIVASDRADTIVEVRPSDAAKKSDVNAAKQTRVEYAGGRLVIKAQKGWRQWTLRGGGESIEVQIALPLGSHLRGEAGIATFQCTGRLGECRYRTCLGDIQLEQAGPVQLKTGVGDISVDCALAHAEITTRGNRRSTRPQFLRRHHNPPLRRHPSRGRPRSTRGMTTTAPI